MVKDGSKERKEKDYISEKARSYLSKSMYWICILRNETVTYLNARTTQGVENLNRPIAMAKIEGAIKILSSEVTSELSHL